MHLAPPVVSSLLPYVACTTDRSISPPRTACANGGVAELSSGRLIRSDGVPLGAAAIDEISAWLSHSSTTYPRRPNRTIAS
jgi:hypothetical protein